MLVQRQTPKRLRTILLIGGGLVAIAAGYLIYQNFFAADTTSNEITEQQRTPVPKDFGQTLFDDPRFVGLAPKPGTHLVTQAAASLPGTVYPAPESGQAFDVKTGGAAVLTWNVPTSVKDATHVRVNRRDGTTLTNLALLPVTARSYEATDLPNNVKLQLEVSFAKLSGTVQSPQVPGKLGSERGGVRVESVSSNSATLVWQAPVGDYQYVEVYRSSAVNVLGREVLRSSAGTLTFTDAVSNPENVFYTVVWVASQQDGQPWVSTLTVTDSTAPEAPDSVRAELVDDAPTGKRVLRVSWSPSVSPDVVRYEVYRSSSELALGGKIADVQTPSGPLQEQALEYIDAGATPGTSYWYSVVAVDGQGNKFTTQELGRLGRANPFLPL